MLAKGWQTYKSFMSSEPSGYDCRPVKESVLYQTTNPCGTHNEVSSKRSLRNLLLCVPALILAVFASKALPTYTFSGLFLMAFLAVLGVVAMAANPQGAWFKKPKREYPYFYIFLIILVVLRFLFPPPSDWSAYKLGVGI